MKAKNAFLGVLVILALVFGLVLVGCDSDGDSGIGSGGSSSSGSDSSGSNPSGSNPSGSSPDSPNGGDYSGGTGSGNANTNINSIVWAELEDTFWEKDDSYIRFSNNIDGPFAFCHNAGEGGIGALIRSLSANRVVFASCSFDFIISGNTLIVSNWNGPSQHNLNGSLERTYIKNQGNSIGYNYPGPTTSPDPDYFGTWIAEPWISSESYIPNSYQKIIISANEFSHYLEDAIGRTTYITIDNLIWINNISNFSDGTPSRNSYQLIGIVTQLKGYNNIIPNDIAGPIVTMSIDGNRIECNIGGILGGHFYSRN